MFLIGIDDLVHSDNILIKGECLKDENMLEEKAVLTQCLNKFGQMFETASCRPSPNAFYISRFLSSMLLSLQKLYCYTGLA